MPKRPSIDDRLSAVMRTKRDSLTPESIATLRAALADSHSVLVEHAARAANELLAGPLIPDLADAFARCLDGQLDDRSCLAATACADALQNLRADEPDLFLRGLKLRRRSPMGDPAAGVRAACAFGLVRCNYRHDLWAIAGLLTDDIAECRVAAARALSMTPAGAAMPLLKYKVLTGDREPDVVVECLSSMAQLDQPLAVPFLAEQLNAADPTVCEGAALALGSTRRADVLPILSAQLQRDVDPSFRKVLLTSIALLRLEAATTYLLDQMKNADSRTAVDAVAALALYKHDPALKARAATAVERASTAVREAFKRDFA